MLDAKMFGIQDKGHNKQTIILTPRVLIPKEIPNKPMNIMNMPNVEKIVKKIVKNYLTKS